MTYNNLCKSREQFKNSSDNTDVHYMDQEHQLPLENDLFDGRYRPIELLGKGGMGKVYLVADTMLDNEEVALKVLKKTLGEEEVHTSRFLREVKLARQITHQNVVRTFDVGTFGEYLYFTMEYVEGISLAEKLKEQETIPYQEVAEIMPGLCEGLHAIHALNVIHRDLKPGNIMITNDGTVKITDFGIARPGTSELTHGDEIIGSSHFIAPEIWVGKELSSATDMYALGVVVFEMLSGCVPFTADNPAELMWKHLEQKPVAPSSIEPSVPKWMDELVLALLAKDDDQRPCNALEVADYVRKCVAKEELKDIRDTFLTPEEPMSYEVVPEMESNNDILTNVPCIEDPLPEFVEAERRRSSAVQSQVIEPQEIRARRKSSKISANLNDFTFYKRLSRELVTAFSGLLLCVMFFFIIQFVGPVLVKMMAKSIAVTTEVKAHYALTLNIGYAILLGASLLLPIFVLHYQLRNKTDVMSQNFASVGVFLACVLIQFVTFWLSGSPLKLYFLVRYDWIVALVSLSPESLYFGFSKSGSVAEQSIFLFCLLYFSHHLFRAVMPKAFAPNEKGSFVLQIAKTALILLTFGLVTALIAIAFQMKPDDTMKIVYGTLQLPIKKIYILSALISWSFLILAAAITASETELERAIH